MTLDSVANDLYKSVESFNSEEPSAIPLLKLDESTLNFGKVSYVQQRLTKLQKVIFHKLLDSRLAELEHTEYGKGTTIPVPYTQSRLTHCRFQLHFAFYLVISALQFVRHNSESYVKEAKDPILNTDPRWLKIETTTVRVPRLMR